MLKFNNEILFLSLSDHQLYSCISRLKRLENLSFTSAEWWRLNLSVCINCLLLNMKIDSTISLARSFYLMTRDLVCIFCELDWIWKSKFNHTNFDNFWIGSRKKFFDFDSLSEIGNILIFFCIIWLIRMKYSVYGMKLRFYIGMYVEKKVFIATKNNMLQGLLTPFIYFREGKNWTKF